MSRKHRLQPDPMEAVVSTALESAGIRFESGPSAPARLDFYLPDHDIYIEVKQMHSDRIAEQMSRAPNVIAIQGMQAARFFASLLQEAAE